MDFLFKPVTSGSIEERSRVDIGVFFEQDAAGTLLEPGREGVGIGVNRLHAEGGVLLEGGRKGNFQCAWG